MSVIGSQMYVKFYHIRLEGQSVLPIMVHYAQAAYSTMLDTAHNAKKER